MSVHRLHDRDGSYDYFLKYCEPVDMIGYSIYIYHITARQAAELRRKLGLRPLNQQERKASRGR